MASKFTPETCALVIQYLRQGTTLEFAARRARVTAKTVWMWRQQGRREGGGAKYDFDVEITKIEADAVAFAENRIQAIIGDKKNPHLSLNAAKFMLSKRAPEVYGDQQFLVKQLRMEITFEIFDMLQERLDAATYDRVLAALDFSAGGPPNPPAALPG